MDKVPCNKRIKQGLEIRKLKAADLCNMTGISKSTMSQYLSGLYEPSQVRTELIARALGVDEAWLMGYDVPMERKTPLAELSEGEQELLNLFHLVPEESQKLILGMIKSALNEAGLL